LEGVGATGRGAGSRRDASGGFRPFASAIDPHGTRHTVRQSGQRRSAPLPVAGFAGLPGHRKRRGAGALAHAGGGLGSVLLRTGASRRALRQGPPRRTRCAGGLRTYLLPEVVEEEDGGVGVTLVVSFWPVGLIWPARFKRVLPV